MAGIPILAATAVAVSGMNCMRPRAAAPEWALGLYLLSCHMMACSHSGSTLYAPAASQITRRYPAGYTSGRVESVFGKRSANEIERSYCPARYEISAAARLGVRVPDQSIQNAASSHNRKKISSDTGSAEASISVRRG